MARFGAGAAVGVASGRAVKCNTQVLIGEPLPDRVAGFGQFLPIALTSQLALKRPLPSGERRLAIPRRCRVLRPTHDPRHPRPARRANGTTPHRAITVARSKLLS